MITTFGKREGCTVDPVHMHKIIFFHDVAGNDGGNDGGDDNDDDSHSDDDTNDEEQWLLLHQQNYQLGLGGSYGLFLSRGL